MFDERTHTLATDEDTRHKQYIKTYDRVHVITTHRYGTETIVGGSVMKWVLNCFQSVGVAFKQEVTVDQTVDMPSID